MINYELLLRKHLGIFQQENPSPYVVAAICQDGKLVAADAHTDNRHVLPLTPESTSFRISSMTKSFAAVAICKLRDNNKLEIDDSITKYLPELELNKRWQEVTIRQLLMMTSGLPSTDDPWADRHLGQTDSFLNKERLNEVLFSSDPDEEFQYSNLGYMLIGRIISNVTKISALDYITEQIIIPLGMQSTTWNLPKGRSVAGYRSVKNTFELETEYTVQSDLGVFGGLCSTLTDLAIWVNFFVDAYNQLDPLLEKILSARSRREMQQMRLVQEPLNSTDRDNFPFGYGYGLGARYIGNEWCIAHSGGLPGFGSHMLWSTTRNIGVIALGNVTYYPARNLCKDIMAEIISLSPRKIRSLPYGSEYIQERGNQLIEIVTRCNKEIPLESFSHNFAADYEQSKLSEQFQDAKKEIQKAKDICIVPERGFAGTIQTRSKTYHILLS